MTTLQENSAQGPIVLERKPKKVNREILDLKTFQTQADNGFEDPVEKLLKEAEKKRKKTVQELRKYNLKTLVSRLRMQLQFRQLAVKEKNHYSAFLPIKVRKLLESLI